MKLQHLARGNDAGRLAEHAALGDPSQTLHERLHDAIEGAPIDLVAATARILDLSPKAIEVLFCR